MSIDPMPMKHLVAHFELALKEGRYFEAHEVLERLWFPRRHERLDEVVLLRACINAAVAFELVKRGRMHSAQKPWQFYLRHRALVMRMPATKNHHYKQLIQAIERVGMMLFWVEDRRSDDT